MDVSLPVLLAVCSLLFLVSLLYSSVGHGGASGYLAVLSFLAVAPAVMSTTALILNVVVSGSACVMFSRAGYFSGRLAVPFIISSVPAAFVGGSMHIPPQVYSVILALVLLYASARLIFEFPGRPLRISPGPPRFSIALPAGAGIGVISGIVGVGGGIFLSPLILLNGWAEAKPTAAVSAFFIFVNSLAGLAGRAYAGTFAFMSLLPFLIVTFAGGLVGSRLGARYLSSLTVRRILGLVLLVASAKLLFTSPVP